jgi:diaminohydroxyphosphoribosylaminopyrimidine deaminase/5-amino-6-(5-phosphoribosylamino)uracil reductase
LTDPDSRVSGAGIARLRAAGIVVDVGLCETEARRLNAGFLMRIGNGRPLFTWKTATSLDGRIATAAGESQWITGEAARAHAHRLRASHDAIMIGIGTALADRPMLTCRLPGLEGRSPVRIVVDSTLRLPPDAPLVATACDIPTWVITGTRSDAARVQFLEEKGVVVLRVPRGEGGLDLNEAARQLAGRGLTRVMVEGGAALAAGMLRTRLIDAIAWFRAGCGFAVRRRTNDGYVRIRIGRLAPAGYGCP